MGHRENQRGVLAQHPVHLAEHPVEVVDGVEGVGAEDQVDAVGPDERQIGQVTLVELDLHVLLVDAPPQVGEAIGGRVDGDRVGALLGEGDRALGAAAKLEDAFALDVAAEPQL